MMRATLLQGSLSGHVSIGGGSRRLHQRWRMQCGPGMATWERGRPVRRGRGHTGPRKPQEQL
jgi:hypothetical protein